MNTPEPPHYRNLQEYNEAASQRAGQAIATDRIEPLLPFPRTSTIRTLLEETHGRLRNLQETLDPILSNGPADKEDKYQPVPPSCFADNCLLEIEMSVMDALRKVISIERRVVFGKS